ncbi:hypothetical protein MMP74_18205 [Acinetobacter sp. NIPH 1869]|uniref:hypothetical protein n=1 Tax=Acinetobacter higginsii TaxID=70347 RepID=UPI001F4A4666|nr:hypothetical protein [Acinetobacter higginsii]MCH7306284.1 hypothetical protein [Acinetobacter higginsii]
MAVYTYLFEARGIQRFLFATGKLKDMLGGSELIDYICAEHGYLDQVLSSLGLKDKVKIPRKAGGVFYLAFDTQQDALRFQAAWRLVAAQWLPSVERVDALSKAENIKDAIKQGLNQLAQTRNKIEIELPSTSPITERSPRTGLAAVTRERGESLDLATATVRHFTRPKDSISLTDRFLPNADVLWPDNFEEDAKDAKRFPLGKRSLVGLIHADGNGLGEILRLLNQACSQASDDVYIDLYKTFSEGITAATVEATKIASKKMLLPDTHFGVMPARPLVLGGDDLSVIVRADLAIPFTQAFLIAFKATSQIEIGKLKDKFKQHNLAQDADKLPDYLTACAGIVFMKASQPFYSAYNLAEGLCKRAKNYSRNLKQNATTEKVNMMPSSLAFYKVTDSVLDDIDAMYAQTQVAQHDKERYELSLTAYLVGENMQGQANLEQLFQLKDIFEHSQLNDRPLREIATLIHINVGQAKQTYRRWNQYSESKNLTQLSTKEQKQASAIEMFKHQFRQIVGGIETDLPFYKVSDREYRSLLADLLTLFVIQQEEQLKSKKKQAEEV